MTIEVMLFRERLSAVDTSESWSTLVVRSMFSENMLVEIIGTLACRWAPMYSASIDGPKVSREEVLSGTVGAVPSFSSSVSFAVSDSAAIPVPIFKNKLTNMRWIRRITTSSLVLDRLEDLRSYKVGLEPLI